MIAIINSIIKINKILVFSLLMIAVQRVTNVAFSLNDGLTKTDEELTGEQRRYAIRYEPIIRTNKRLIDINRKKPTILEFFSYLFQFPTLLCGPLVYYNDYIEFIDGHNFERHLRLESELPSPLVSNLLNLA